MKNEIISNVIRAMADGLDNLNLKKLKEVLENTFYDLKIEKVYKSKNQEGINASLVNSFISSKRVEGCSNKTIYYYQYTLRIIFKSLNKDIIHLITEDIRGYLYTYQKNSNVSKGTINNVRRVLASFF